MKIACIIPGGVGGTQKAAWLFAKGLARLEHDVTVFSGEGPYKKNVGGSTGLTVHSVTLETECLSAIHDCHFDALHLHVPGYYLRHPIYPFLQSMGKRRPRVVETNILGWLSDWRAHATTDYHLFVSMSSACQAARRSWKQLPNLKKCGVSRNPVCPPRPFSSGNRHQLRESLGFSDTDIIALRLGRPDAAKWTDWECLAVDAARKAGATQLKLLAIEPPMKLRIRIAQGHYGEGVSTHPMLVQPGDVEALIDACDVILHTARFGESFGYAIAEGMAAGKPVISRTTPWGDNAQVELVEHGHSGFICCSLEGLASALLTLVEDAALRKNFGVAGKKRILEIADIDRECAVLEAALTNNHQHLLEHRWQEVQAFASTFHSREWNVFEHTDRETARLDHRILQKEKKAAWWRQKKSHLSAAKALLRAALGKTAYRT